MKSMEPARNWTFAFSVVTLSILAQAVTFSGAANAATFNVTINTAALRSADAALAFDLIDGDSPPNSVTVYDFATDGILSPVPALAGAASGTLAGVVALNDSAFFNEFRNQISLGTNISFTVATTDNSLVGGSLPDAFSFFILDHNTGLPLFDTTEPNDSGALFVLEFDGSVAGNLGVYEVNVGGPAVSWAVTPAIVPIPTALLSILSAIGVLLGVSNRRRASYDCRPRLPS